MRFIGKVYCQASTYILYLVFANFQKAFFLLIISLLYPFSFLFIKKWPHNKGCLEQTPQLPVPILFPLIFSRGCLVTYRQTGTEGTVFHCFSFFKLISKIRLLFSLDFHTFSWLVLGSFTCSSFVKFSSQTVSNSLVFLQFNFEILIWVCKISSSVLYLRLVEQYCMYLRMIHKNSINSIDLILLQSLKIINWCAYFLFKLHSWPTWPVFVRACWFILMSESPRWVTYSSEISTMWLPVHLKFTYFGKKFSS